MKVLNLRCAHDHRFEGWFSGDEDLQAQLASGSLACPLCNDTAITRLPSAPHLLRGARPAPSDAAAPPATPEQLQQAQWLGRVRALVESSVDVGDRFAAEARRIHYGEAEERAIRGRSSAEEAQALADEGIEVMALSLPEAFKGTLQ